MPKYCQGKKKTRKEVITQEKNNSQRIRQLMSHQGQKLVVVCVARKLLSKAPTTHNPGEEAIFCEGQS